MKIRREKIQFFEKQVDDFFRKTGRVELPWRKKGITAYEVWVSEIMLQQTQVVRVIIYYKNFLKRFPTVENLALATWEDFLPYYQGLGYYARGRNMLKTARMIVSKHAGKFPRDKKLLEALPGIGPYTATAVLSFAYGENHLAWDTNLKRVIGRFFFGGKHLVGDETFWEEKFRLPRKEMNAALMDFGSALCVARPKCEACSLRSRCVYYQEKGEKELRIKKRELKSKKKTDWNDAQVHLFLHEDHKKYFSAEKNRYMPFVLPSGCTARAGIKRYFLEKYGLTLAVRPPYQKLIIADRPTFLVNAQILLGRPKFTEFSKKAWKEYTESIDKVIG